jgi:hypothetical protein
VTSVGTGGGYLPYTAVTDRHIKAVATVSAITSPRATLVGGFAGPWQHLMAAAGTARTAYARGGEARSVQFMPDGLQSEWADRHPPAASRAAIRASRGRRCRAPRRPRA